eukprot:g39113.t1
MDCTASSGKERGGRICLLMLGCEDSGELLLPGPIISNGEVPSLPTALTAVYIPAHVEMNSALDETYTTTNNLQTEYPEALFIVAATNLNANATTITDFISQWNDITHPNAASDSSVTARDIRVAFLRVKVTDPDGDPAVHSDSVQTRWQEYLWTSLTSPYYDVSSTSNTIIPTKLISKLQDLGLCSPFCNWILDILTHRLQSVRI